MDVIPELADSWLFDLISPWKKVADDIFAYAPLYLSSVVVRRAGSGFVTLVDASSVHNIRYFLHIHPELLSQLHFLKGNKLTSVARTLRSMKHIGSK